MKRAPIVSTLTDEQARTLRILREARADVTARMRELDTGDPLRRALEAEHARLWKRSRAVIEANR